MRHPLPYAFARTAQLLLEDDGHQLVLWHGPAPDAGALSEVLRKHAVQQLLPLAADEKQALQKRDHNWDYLYEPDAKHLLDALFVRFIESQVYQGVVENIACEQAARMVAMKSATDNAGDLIRSLQLVYNKLRQAAITQEISEIVGGAAAV